MQEQKYRLKSKARLRTSFLRLYKCAQVLLCAEVLQLPPLVYNAQELLLRLTIRGLNIAVIPPLLSPLGCLDKDVVTDPSGEA